MPNVFARPAATTWGTKDTAGALGLTAPALRAHGGGSSYEQTFVPKLPLGEGVSFVTDRIFRFATAADAKWAFSFLRRTLEHSGVNGTQQVHPIVYLKAAPDVATGLDQAQPQNATPYQTAKIATVGDEDAGFTVVSVAGGGETAYENHLVAFHQGRYCATVRIAGVFEQVPWSMAIGLARKLTTRIRQSS